MGTSSKWCLLMSSFLASPLKLYLVWKKYKFIIIILKMGPRQFTPKSTFWGRQSVTKPVLFLGLIHQKSRLRSSLAPKSFRPKKGSTRWIDKTKTLFSIIFRFWEMVFFVSWQKELWKFPQFFRIITEASLMVPNFTISVNGDNFFLFLP